MKKVLSLVLVLFSANLLAADGCKQVGELKKCEIEMGRYLTDLGKCKVKPSNSSSTYAFGYFSVGEIVLKQTWLEDQDGVMPGTLERTVQDDFKTIQTDSAWYYNSDALSRCNGKRDAYALRLESKRKIKEIIRRFLKN